MADWKEKSAQLFETCSSKRMLTSIGAMVVFCVLIVMVEEIAEEKETKGDFDVKDLIRWNQSAHSNDAKFDAFCYESEAVSLLYPCSPCTDFERKAIKSKHCVSTGFFERVRCSKSGSLSLRPCSPLPGRDSLFSFAAFSLLLALVAGVAAQHRKGHLERHAYSRLSQDVN